MIFCQMNQYTQAIRANKVEEIIFILREAIEVQQRCDDQNSSHPDQRAITRKCRQHDSERGIELPINCHIPHASRDRIQAQDTLQEK